MDYAGCTCPEPRFGRHWVATVLPLPPGEFDDQSRKSIADGRFGASAGHIGQTNFLIRSFTFVGKVVMSWTMLGSFLGGLRCSFLGGWSNARSARASARFGCGLWRSAGSALSDGKLPAEAVVGTTLVPFVPGKRTTIGADSPRLLLIRLSLTVFSASTITAILA